MVTSGTLETSRHDLLAPSGAHMRNFISLFCSTCLYCSYTETINKV